MKTTYAYIKIGLLLLAVELFTAVSARADTFMRADGTPLQFDGLWGLLPLTDGVFFTAGIVNEAHGLFGISTED